MQDEQDHRDAWTRSITIAVLVIIAVAVAVLVVAILLGQSIANDLSAPTDLAS